MAFMARTRIEVFRPWPRGAAAVVILTLVAAGALPAGGKKKKAPEQASPQALISGTVFEQSGRSLPGAKVAIVSESNPKTKLGGVTNQRGEFAVRVPAGQSRYLVTASAKGFDSQQATVEVFDSEKVIKNFLLSPRDTR